MLNFFRELRRQSLLNAAVTIVLGLILIFAPGGMIALVLGLIGWILVITGILSIISFVVNRHSYPSYGQLIFGLIRLFFGLWIVRNPSGVVSLVATIVGIIMLIHACTDLQYTVNAYQAGAANWGMAAISGGLTLILALIVFFNPFGSVVTLVTFAGVCLVLDGISDLLMVHRMGDTFRSWDDRY